jgi:catechol 2,3-dioxygenase-like lactoylglutathione lyase family enzyme
VIRIGSVIMKVDDVEDATQFWADALGYEVAHIAADWGQVRPRVGQGPRLSFDLRDRMHLDLYTADAADQVAEVERLMRLGARQVADWPYPPDADFTVLSDPSGNLFCVVAGGAQD